MEHRQSLETDEVDELVAVLSETRRRTVLEYLRDAPAETVPLEDLARELAGRDAPDDETRIVLHHVTLPALARTGVVDYDADRHTVTYRGDEPVETLLEEVRFAGDRTD